MLEVTQIRHQKFQVCRQQRPKAQYRWKVGIMLADVDINFQVNEQVQQSEFVVPDIRYRTEILESET